MIWMSLKNFCFLKAKYEGKLFWIDSNKFIDIWVFCLMFIIQVTGSNLPSETNWKQYFCVCLCMDEWYVMNNKFNFRLVFIAFAILSFTHMYLLGHYNNVLSANDLKSKWLFSISYNTFIMFIQNIENAFCLSILTINNKKILENTQFALHRLQYLLKLNINPIFIIHIYTFACEWWIWHIVKFCGWKSIDDFPLQCNFGNSYDATATTLSLHHNNNKFWLKISIHLCYFNARNKAHLKPVCFKFHIFLNYISR